MELRPGYKQTEVGVIPEDWDIVLLGSLGAFAKGQGIRKDEAASGDIPCIRYGEIYTHHNDIIRTFNSRVSAEVAKTSKRLKKGDLLFAGSGETKEEIGKCVAFIGDDIAYAGGDIVILSPVTAVPTFLGYLLNAPVVARQKASKGQGDAVVHISSSALATIKIPLPPTKAEQESIAAALSDVDALLAKLDQFIAKKRDLKQAAMQQLLTGQTRLPGFKQEWQVKLLGEIIDTLADYTANGSFEALKNNVTYFETRNYAVLVRTTDLDKPQFKPERFTDKRGYKFLAKTALFGGELVIANVGSIGKVFRVPFFEMPMTLAPNTYLLKFSRNVDESYIYQWMRTEGFYAKLMSKIGSSTLQAINKDNLRSIEICMPSNIEEQTAIATVLSDMDAELASLKARRDKTRALKQGMMQELLTGRIRLV